MNSHQLLQLAHKAYCFFFRSSQFPMAEDREDDPERVASMIVRLIESGLPGMVARLGSGELSVATSYSCRQKHICSAWKYITGRQPSWWWTKEQIVAISRNAGLFNPTEQTLARFSQIMINDMRQVDILGSWLHNEQLFTEELGQAKCVRLRYLEPFWAKEPWTRHLEGKRVVVVHPFAETIEKQYAHRELLFNNTDTLPPFKSLRVIKAVQSIGNESNGFNTWFDALKYMEEEMDKLDYDIALIGCGAYGFPLAAHAKRTGKVGIHLGGSLQLLFGIKGNRWFNPSSKAHYADYSPLANKYWVNPEEKEKPAKANEIEDACYW